MNYWLLKAEPHIYGIDHLAAEQHQIGRWDGIRNYQARNFIRDQFKPGDLVFIYHSGIKNPAVVGTACIQSPAYPDPLQFNPESNYYDPKSSTEKPRWFSVDVKFLSRFKNPVYLRDLKTFAPLQEMVLLKQGRLSTQPVTKPEWEFINHLAQ